MHQGLVHAGRKIGVRQAGQLGAVQRISARQPVHLGHSPGLRHDHRVRPHLFLSVLFAQKERVQIPPTTGFSINRVDKTHIIINIINQ